jgi:hypothetical protein
MNRAQLEHSYATEKTQLKPRETQFRRKKHSSLTACFFVPGFRQLRSDQASAKMRSLTVFGWVGIRAPFYFDE